MADTPFDRLQAEMQGAGADLALEHLADWLRGEKRYHELFDTRLMQARRRLGLPAILTTPLEELDEPLRAEVESAYLAACREAGWLLWDIGEIRQAWMYLRPLGDTAAVAAAMAKLEPTETNRNELIEIALREGVAPALGLQWVIDNFGTCNAITAYDSEMPRVRRSQQKSAAVILIRHLYGELLGNLRAEILRQEGREPSETTIADLIRGRDQLFGEHSYHIDASHLASVVRIARIVEDEPSLRYAWELTQYGGRLSGNFQFAGDAPFDDVYRSHGLFFAAQLEMQVDEALQYFRERAERANPEEDGTAAAEVYIVLLVRLRRYSEALEAYLQFMPPDIRPSGFAPTLLELGQLSREFERLADICRRRDDLLGFAAGLIAKNSSASNETNIH